MNTNKFEDRAGELMLVPLSRLVASRKRNVRKNRPSAEYREGLKASIQAQGVLQNLIVCPALNGKDKETGDFEVVSGDQPRCRELLGGSLSCSNPQVKRARPGKQPWQAPERRYVGCVFR
jgi:hypothetical protein